MKQHWTLVGAACALALAGCSMDNQTPMGRDFGESVRHNIMVQTIDPEPPYADAGAPDMNGRRAVDAFTRYETDKVKQPRPETTSDIMGTTGN